MIFLEQWIHNKIKQELRGNPELCLDLERQLTRKEIEDFQLFKLRGILSYALEKSLFYQNLFTKEGVRPEDVRSVDDLAEVPFTYPTDLAESPYRFLCISLAEVKRVYTFSTAGTTGNPKKVFFPSHELGEISDYMGAAMKTVAMCGGAGESDYTVFILLPDGKPDSQANLLAEGVKKYGGKPVKADLTLDAGEQIKTIAKTNPDILFGSVSRLWRMTQETKQSHELSQIGVKALFLTSEYLPRAMRQDLKEIWGSDVYLHYGMTEMGFGGGIECSAHNGFHFNETDFLFEVVDPLTGKRLECDEKGELAFTTLSRKGMPLIRYRTGDLACLTSKPCECGASTLQRIGEIRGRVKSEVKIGRGEVYPSLFDDALYKIPGLVDYRIFLDKEGERDSLTCKVELIERRKKVQEEIRRSLSEMPSIKEATEADLITEPQVELVDRGALKRKGRAKQHIIDNR